MGGIGWFRYRPQIKFNVKKKIGMKMQDFSVSVDLSVFIGDLETEGYLSDLDTDDYGM